jgi:hypothetical protein
VTALPEPLSVVRRAVTVSAVDATAHTVTVLWADGVTTTAGVPCLAPYIPRPNDVVLLDLVAGSPLVIGAVGSARTGVRLRRAANQSITNNASNTVSWDTQDEELGGAYWGSGTTVTIPTGLGGLYAIEFRAGVATTGSARNFAEVAITSSITGIPVDFREDMAAAENRLRARYWGPLAAGDTFVVNVLQATGASQNLTAWLSCYRIGE